MPRLIVTRGADEGKQYNLNVPLVLIGRDPAARVRLLDTEISRRHAELVETSDGYRLRDLGSANGTFVNGRSVQDVLLRSGDRVQVGQTVLVIVAEGSRKSGASSLAEKINLVTGQVQGSLGGTVVSRLGETEGDKLLTRGGRVKANGCGALWLTSESCTKLRQLSATSTSWTSCWHGYWNSCFAVLMRIGAVFFSTNARLPGIPTQRLLPLERFTGEVDYMEHLPGN